MSEPERIGTNSSATAAERLKRGSTTTMRAPRFLASTAHLKPTGWASAGFPPMTRMKSALRMSTQWLVMAPRPKVAASAETVGPWQTRAWASVPTMPKPRRNFWVRMPVSLEAAEAVSMAVEVQRFTGTPSALAATTLASRSAFICRAMRSMASCQLMRFHALLPASRTSGYFRRLGLWMKSRRPAPLGHSEPRLTGWSGSPSMCMIDALAFMAPSPKLYISRPQPTEQ